MRARTFNVERGGWSLGLGYVSSIYRDLTTISAGSRGKLDLIMHPIKEVYTKFLRSHFPPVRFAFAYGSAVFKQHGRAKVTTYAVSSLCVCVCV